MKYVVYFLTLPLIALMIQCTQSNSSKQEVKGSPIPEAVVQKVIGNLLQTHGEQAKFRIERGVKQVATLWRTSDGSTADFEQLCSAQFITDPAAIETLFNKVSYSMEVLNGYFLRINKDLLRPLHLEMGPVTPIDEMFGGYNAGAHLSEDLYSNRIAFIVALNFPFYSLKEKTELGNTWTRLEWGYARMGDLFTSRIPAELQQRYSLVSTNADTYISNYYIYMGSIRNEGGEQLFPNDMKLISHWNLRDELKSQYGNKEGGLERQKMVYQVMQRIIDQSIPEKVINSSEFQWKPISNQLSANGEAVEFTPEPNTRYQQVVNLYGAIKAIDAFNPAMPTYIQRKFEGEFEIPVDDVEKLFTEFVSSEQVRATGKLIAKRLGRPLEPFDIWYDGFKSRSSIPAEKLNAAVSKRFSNAASYQNEIPKMLTSLGWTKEKAQFFSEKINVEGSRGAGHAWGGAMRADVALLRTNIPSSGMNYKGFNIAMHEFGHTVEQTITLHDVDHYMLNGVPNTAFTEALAFIFQARDLDVLGFKDPNPEKAHLDALDHLWSCYEIMGVSLVDINLWKWLYANPNANAQQVKEAAISIAKEIWNKYYADVFGSKDEPILAIYSHMIDNPLYLSAYPLGHLIDFQIENHIADKHFATEVQRMFVQGRVVPQLWMMGAVGKPLSITPTLEAAGRAIEVLNK
jgi:hypothetical protein